MPSFLRQLKTLDQFSGKKASSSQLDHPVCQATINRYLVTPLLLPLLVLVSPSVAYAAPLTSTDIYVLSGAGASVNQIKILNTTTGALSSTLFTTGAANSAALGFDPVGLQLYYSDRSLTPNNLRRYDGTTQSSSLGTFAGSDNANIAMLRMGFRASTGYAISNDNTMYTFTTGATPTISSLGLVSFIGASPSGATSSGDIAFDGYGFGWAIFGNSLYRLNLTGSLREAIPIGQITVGGSPLVVPTVANGNNGTTVGSIAFDATGALYVAGVTVVNGSATGTTIYKVNVNDATAVQVGALLSGTIVSDFASASQPLIAPILQATKTVSPTGLAKPGDTLTYTIEIENTGTAPAVNLDFSDVLPAGTTYVASSATLNGTSLGAASYPFASPYRINGRNASLGSLKVGNANRATITFQVTINTSSVPTSITNQGTVVYLDGTPGGVPTTSATTTVTSPVSGYKSVKLTNDADGSGTITPGDTVTWTISYKNSSTAAVSSFQINDPLPAGVTLTSAGGQTVTVSGGGTSATKNNAYTGTATGTVSNLLSAGATVGANGVVTVNIPTIVNSGFTGTLSNQPNATGASIPGTGTLTDNVDNTSSVPAGVTVPAGSVAQVQTATVDPTTTTVVAPIPTNVTVSGTVWADANGNAILAAPEAGTEAGSSTLTIYAVDSSGNVLDKSDVAANGTYSLSLPQNTNGVTLRLSNDATKTAGQVAPTAASLPSGWINTGENKNGTTEFTTLGDIAINTTTTNITNQNFGIEQLPNTTDLTPASQTNPGGTATVQVPTLAGTDPEDGALGSGKSFKIVTLPTNGTLTYNNNPVTAGQVITSYDPTLLKLDPNDGAITVSFTYAAIDAAGKEDPTPATVTIPFTASAVINISGTLYRDNDRSSTNNSEPGIGNIRVLLYKDNDNNGEINTTNEIIQQVNTLADGSYQFTNVAPGTYKIKVDVADTDVPLGYTLGTSDNLSVTVNTTSITSQDFGFYPASTCEWDAQVYSGHFPVPGQGGSEAVPNGYFGISGLPTLRGTAKFGAGISKFTFNDQTLNATDHPLRTIKNGSFPSQGYVPINGDYGSVPHTGGDDPNWAIVFKRQVSANGRVTLGQPGANIDDAMEIYVNGGRVGNPILGWTPSLAANQVSTVAVNAGDIVEIRLTNYGYIGGFLVTTEFVYDFGDAPNSYGEVSQAPNCGNPILGATATGENSQSYSANADGDAGDDGVTLPSTLTPGTTATITVNASNAGFLNSWIDFNKNGVFDSGEQLSLTNVTKGTAATVNNVPLNAGNNTLTFTVPSNATLGSSFARFRYTTSSVTTPSSTGSGDAGEVEDYAVTIAVPSTPKILLVKRITAINGSATGRDINGNVINFNQFVNDTNTTDDNAPNWISDYLKGAIDAGVAKVNDELEYTIYFLSNGTNLAKNALICDRIPDNATFLPTAFNSGSFTADLAGLPGADRGIVFSLGGSGVSLSNVADGDRGQFFPAGVEPTTVYPQINCGGANTNGAIVVNLGDLPNATAAGVPTNSYGFIRFRANVR